MIKERILITGGAGYIGSHTFVELCRFGFSPVIVDNFCNSSPEILNNLKKICGFLPEYYTIDLAEPNALQILNQSVGSIDGIIHFAALKSVGESVKFPIEYYRNNINSLATILQFIKQREIRSFVFSSSCTVYGQPEVLPVTEESPLLMPFSPYGKTKQFGEELIRDFFASSVGGNAILLRYFNPIGAHESGLIGEHPQGIPNNLMPFITKTALGILPELKVFGNDYNTPDGTAIRDYIHVSDLAEAHIRALKWLMQPQSLLVPEVINLGLGHGYSVLEVIQSFERMSGLSLNYSFAPRRSGDVEKIWTETRKMNQLLDFFPQRNIDDMTSTAWEWEKKLNLKK